MAYIPLGSRYALAAADQTGQNDGNYTTAFTADILGINVPYFEVFHAVVENVPAGASAKVAIGIRAFSFTFPFTGSEWDPTQPPLIQPGQDLFFFWSIADSGTAPATTIWLRYDTAVIEAARKGYIT